MNFNLSTLFSSSGSALRTIAALTLLVSLGVQAHPEHAHDEKHSTDLSPEEQALLADDGKIALRFASKEIDVELADSPDERALGLMYRSQLCEDCGMLFQFDTVRIASIWMKNTKVPLDLAYISEEGEIIAIDQLEPFNLTPVPSPIPVRYALEMNQGWFASNGIKVGDALSIEGKVTQPNQHKH